MKQVIQALVLMMVFAGSAFADGMTVTSKVMGNGVDIAPSQVFNGFGCTGANISPDLKWAGAPEGTKSYAVTLFDPDAPTGSGWWHWVVFNIPATATSLRAAVGTRPEAPLPKGAIQSRTDFGKPGYGGPCPPAGDKAHRYILKVYALKDVLPLDKEASGAMVGFYISQLKLGEATITAKFGR